MRCKAITTRGAPCRNEAPLGDYCQHHAPAVRVVPGVTLIQISSKELRTGQIVRERAKGQRPRAELKRVSRFSRKAEQA